jgi:hypothetical protein
MRAINHPHNATHARVRFIVRAPPQKFEIGTTPEKTEPTRGELYQV